MKLDTFTWKKRAARFNSLIKSADVYFIVLMDKTRMKKQPIVMFFSRYICQVLVNVYISLF